MHQRPSPRLTLLLVLSASLLGVSCTSGGGGSTDSGAPPLGGVGDDCGAPVPCRYPLFCDLGTCAIHGSQNEGDDCTFTAQCIPGLYCAEARVCQPAGTGDVGSICASTAECSVGLVCAPQVAGSQCFPAGTIDVGGACTRTAQCLAGLTCVGIQCTDGSGPGMDASMDAGRDAGRDAASDSGSRDAFVPPDVGILPDANLGCDRTACDDDNPCTLEKCAGEMCINELVDFDNDGYASTAFGAICGDCSDSEGEAHPGQTRWFTRTHRAGAIPGDVANYDWNCDGTEEQQYTNVIDSCGSAGRCVVSAEGWQGGVPACGATGNWVSCDGSCDLTIVDRNRRQACR